MGDEDIRPSIRGRKLYIPLMAWFCSSTKNALPLIALQYQEINIRIEFRPVKELFTILHITGGISNNKTFYSDNKIHTTTTTAATTTTDTTTTTTKEINNTLRMRPNPPGDSAENVSFYKFLQKPPKQGSTDNDDSYITSGLTNYDIHLIGNYVFLDNDERNILALKKHKFLIKCCYEWDFYDITGSKRIKIPSRDMVSSYMWRFRRDDVGDRNQWHNYQNFEWENVEPKDSSSNLIDFGNNDKNEYNLHSSPELKITQLKSIMSDMAILCGGEYRENTLDSGVYEFIEKWYRSTGNSKDGLYLYNFCINSNRLSYQPTGAQNTNKWQNVIFEFNTITPPKESSGEVSISVFCEEDTLVGVRKKLSDLYEYNFDLRVFEERYNMIQILGGNISMLLAR
jgi:hypothetical protein